MMTLIRRQPWSLTHRWRPEFDRLLGEMLDVSEPALTNGATWTPSIDVQEENDRFVLSADVPGVESKDIEVSAADGILTIRAERLTKERVDSDSFEHAKRVAGTFLRHITLPDSVQADAIKAHYANGVLEIEIPKQARVEAKRIPVTAN